MLVIKDKTKNKFIEIGNIVQPLKNDLTQVEAGKYALDAAQGYKLNGDIAEKLDKNLGATESGKYLKVDTDGAIITDTVSGGVDVQINGTSIVQDGVANIPVANNTFGVVKVAGYSGLRIHTDNSLRINEATDNQITLRYGLGAGAAYGVITPNKLDYAVKCALTDGKGAAYTDEEKASARERLGAESSVPMSSTPYVDITTTEEVEEIVANIPSGWKHLRVTVTVPASTENTSAIPVYVFNSSQLTDAMSLYQNITAKRNATVVYHILNGYCFAHWGVIPLNYMSGSWSFLNLAKFITEFSSTIRIGNVTNVKYPIGTMVKIWGC